MGSISLDTLVLAKKYTDTVLTGLGALKGSPCTLKATKENDDGSITVTFSWTDSKGVEETQDVIIPAGPQGPQGEQGEKGTDGTNGVSPTVTITEIDGGHTITITDADGTQSFNVLNGADGYSPSAKVEKENGVVTITITDKTGTTTAEIKENAGAGGAGEENVIEEIKVNGVALEPDENKSVDITVPTVDVDKNYVDTELAKKANIADIPTNVSELQNDSKYQTDIDVKEELQKAIDNITTDVDNNLENYYSKEETDTLFTSQKDELSEYVNEKVYESVGEGIVNATDDEIDNLFA